MAQNILIAVGASVMRIDWIMHQGTAWLVPHWISTLGGTVKRPLRIISLKMAPGYENYPLGEGPLEYFQANPLPRSLLDQGVIPPELAMIVEVRENPDISVPIQNE